MKLNSSNNPESNMDASLNLPSIASLSNYEQYENEKKQRKDLQKRRKMLEETVSNLRREAEQSTRKFNQTQDQLMFAYNKKLTTLDEAKQKNQLKRQRKEELERKRNFSSLTRYLHHVKKDEALQNLITRKKQMINTMKMYLQDAESKKNKNQKDYQVSLNQKNKKMNETNRFNRKWARDKSFDQKKKASQSVRKRLIEIEEDLMQKQKARIDKLEIESQNIMNLLQKTSEKKNEVENMKEELSSMDIYDFESRVVQNAEESRISQATKKITRSKRKKSHQRNLDLFYY